MRVKLLIAIAIASLFVLVSALPAGAVEGTTGVSSTNVVVPQAFIAPPVVPSTVVPCISFQAPTAPAPNTVLANTITLGGPALQTQIQLFGPQGPSFSSPTFVL